MIDFCNARRRHMPCSLRVLHCCVMFTIGLRALRADGGRAPAEARGDVKEEMACGGALEK